MMKLFTLIISWISEDGQIDVHLESFMSKEAMLEGKKYFEQKLEKEIAAGDVVLSPAVECSWADFERLF